MDRSLDRDGGQTPRRSNNDPPDLCFMSGGETSGFTSSGITSFQDINPVAIVRELLQNSLDAVRDTGRKTAHVRFELTDSHPLENIPGITTYQKIFKQAVKDQKQILNDELPDQAQSVVDVITEYLGKDKCVTLYVLDDGIGLDQERMKGLLGDGVSIKKGSSTGAVGNGHLTALPASGLRYVLYGGLYGQDEMICAGHAVLASHTDGSSSRRMSKDGYFVSGLRQDDFYDPYVFTINREIPEYIRSRLDWIRGNWDTGTGTVVAIPAFNNFREGKKSLWETVSLAAACNFFAAFAEKQLEIEVVENREANTLNHKNIRDILEKVKDKPRARSKFLSGARAYSAFEAITIGESISVSTDIGNLSMKVLQNVEDSHPGKTLTRIDLCRNGMWVTGQLPGLDSRQHFTNQLPFHCVILLEAKDGEIHRLVRKAEGPLHNELRARKWLKAKEREKLETAIKRIHEKLKEVVPSYETEKYRLPDVLSVDVRGISSGGRRQRAGEINRFSKIPRRTQRKGHGEEEEEGGKEEGEGERVGNGSNGGEEHNRGGGSFHKRGVPVPFDATSSLINARSCIIEIIPKASVSSAEVRFSVDENLDETWEDNRARQFVKVFQVRVDGCSISDDRITHDRNDNPLGVRLGELEQGRSLTLEFDFELPEETELPDDMLVALKTQLVRDTWSTHKKKDEKK